MWRKLPRAGGGDVYLDTQAILMVEDAPEISGAKVYLANGLHFGVDSTAKKFLADIGFAVESIPEPS